MNACLSHSEADRTFDPRPHVLGGFKMPLYPDVDFARTAMPIREVLQFAQQCRYCGEWINAALLVQCEKRQK